MPPRLVVPLLFAAIWAPPASAAEKWRLEYFYDQPRASLVINDLTFPSATHGVAAGYIDEHDRNKPAILTTDDGGAHWAVSSFHHVPVSLFFLNANLGWAVAPEGIWGTKDGGKSWHELYKSPKLLLQVHFLDEQHGFAIGARRSVYRTDNGGKSWEPIAAADVIRAGAESAVYNSISFADRNAGFISGYDAPPRSVRPSWLTPDQAASRRERPTLAIRLSTTDGGRTWRPDTFSMLGRITSAAYLPDGATLAVLQFLDHYDWPSEVRRFETTGTSTAVFGAKDRDITDLLVLPDGTVYLAALEVEGRLQHSPIPRRLRILKSTDLFTWTEMAVDYRASAVHAILRRAPDGAVWVATDTGMMLKLAHQ
jgi:hypothetical protein